MRVIEPGHIYELEWLDGPASETWGVAMRDLGLNTLIFVGREREKGIEHPGTQCQEVIRALIDRVQHCDAQLRWEGNDQIVEYLRKALVLFEARALIRKTEKGILLPEQVATGLDGHFQLVGEEEPINADH